MGHTKLCKTEIIGGIWQVFEPCRFPAVYRSQIQIQMHFKFLKHSFGAKTLFYRLSASMKSARKGVSVNRADGFKRKCFVPKSPDYLDFVKRNKKKFRRKKSEMKNIKTEGRKIKLQIIKN